MPDVNSLLQASHALYPRGGGLNPPAEVLINWPAPNYVNPETRGVGAPIFILILLVITILVFIARIWARLVVAKNAGWDDIMMSCAMLPLIGLTVSAYLGITKLGFQWHTWDQTKATFVSSRQITMSIELNYLVSTTFIKVSILMFYRRITGSLTHTFVYMVWGSIVLCIVYGLVYTLLIVFMCTPVAGYFYMFDLVWRSSHEMYCRNEGAIVVSCAIMSTVQDLVICMLPVLLIWNLQIAQRQKIALCGIFGLGLVTCVCGIMRSYYASYCFFFTYDITWVAFHGWIWTALEAQLAVICASAPALKVFFLRYFSSAGSQLSSSGTGSRKTPMRSFRSRGYGKMSSATANSTLRSQNGGISGSEVPLGGITVSQDLQIQVADRDDVSHKSNASTKKLTALPPRPRDRESGNRKSEWLEGCRTVCAAAMSRDPSRTRSSDKDLERGTP